MVTSTMVPAGELDSFLRTAQVDTRLIAAVQASAGARCHEAANLLQNYYFCVEACHCVTGPGRAIAPATEAWQACNAAKVRLREFLGQRVYGWAAAAPERRLNQDRCAPGTLVDRPNGE